MTANQRPEDCFICRKHRGEIFAPGGVLYEDAVVYAGHIGNILAQTEQPLYLSYLFVETKRHVPGLADLTDDEAQATGLLVTRLSRALKACTTAEHIYAFVLGHHVPHLHIHVLPRYPGAPQEYWGIHTDEWPGAPRGNLTEIEALCERIRAFLNDEQALAPNEETKSSC